MNEMEVSARMSESGLNAIALRLNPGDDLRQSLLAYCIDHTIDAAYLLSGIGSLHQAVIRFANQPTGTGLEQPLEILSLAGTLSRHGVHLHIVVSDSDGQLVGGHLLDGSLIRTTAEIVLGVVPNVIFQRSLDPCTGYKELEIIASGL